MQINLKIINICLILAVTAFMVATIVLAVQKSNLQADLDDLKEKLDYYESASEGALKPKSQRSLIDVLVKRERREETINYRLPNSMRPISYKLYLHPNLKTGNFSGQEVIIVDVQSATKQIILHSHKLIINNVYVRGPNDANLEIESYSIDTVREFLVINMVNELRANANIELGIIFEGTMIDKIVGLYSSTYSTPAMETRKIATSKFEPTYARQSFPCFDEPAMKAKFDITLVHPSGDKYHALSNMNELSTEFLGEYTETRFQPSVEMSTYVACFLVSDFSHKTKPVNTQGIGENFNIRIYATEHQLDKVDFALDTGIAVTEYYIQYFKVEYPLPKLDMAAIPDFASNAMEHWGLLTYRETALLYDKTISSTYNKQRVAAVVSHELAHMWFGNLVTMKWWNDLWLNEGFARYIQYKGVNAAYPTWGMLDLFLIEALHNVMKYDATTASHPIVQPVETPDQISEIFDTISYEKGGSVIRMLENIVGSTKFEQAVTNYLNKFKYGNAETDDFLTEVAATNLDFDVKLMMRTWTEQMGYPVVEVKRIGDGKFNVTQKRFLSNIADYNLAFDDSPFDYKWMIPLTYATNEQNTYSPLWFDYNKANVEISVPASAKWIKLNMQQVGYYRVNYEKDNWLSIIEDLKQQPKTAFSIADRAHLLDDAFALADANQLDYSIALDMTVYLENESDFVPWYVAATKLLDLQRKLTLTGFQVDYLRYARQLLTKIYTEVGWTVDEDNHLKNRLRVTVLNAACALGHPDCLDEAALRFNAWLLNPTTKPSPDLRETIYYYGMQRVNTVQAWNQMWELMVKEEDANEKLKLMYGLSAVRLPWLLHRYAELAGNEENVRRRDLLICLQYIAANPVGEPIVWEYVREEWPALVARFTLNDRYFGRMVSTITENFTSQTKLEEMQNFFEKYPEAGAGTAARKQAIEKVKYNMQWLEQNKDEVGHWLQKYFEVSQAIENI